MSNDGYTPINIPIYRYEEDILKVGRKKTNVMIIGDGKGKTVISGGKSVQDNMTTFHTATFGKFQFPPPSFIIFSISPSLIVLLLLLPPQIFMLIMYLFLTHARAYYAAKLIHD